MKLKIYLFAALTAFALCGCYNDDKLWDAVNEQEQRITALENWQKVANNNIEALQTLVSGKHYITDVTPIILDGKTVGYTIAFNDLEPISIYHGEKGEQGDKGEQGITGSTPIVSMVQQEDGNWYWTLNGELMMDAAGNPIRANGEDGKDGQDGKPGQNAPTPVLKTGQALTNAGIAGNWTPDAVYLSVDNEKTWTLVSGKPGTNGTDGDSFFSGVDTKTNNDYVIFHLSQGGEIRVPRYKGAGLRFDIAPDLEWQAGESLDIPCTITYPAGGTHSMEFISPKGWKAKLNAEETVLAVTAPAPVDFASAELSGKIIAILSVDDDQSIVRTIQVKTGGKLAINTNDCSVARLLENGYDGTSLTITGGPMDQADFDALKANTTITHLDMWKADVTDLPEQAFEGNATLTSVVVPTTVKAIPSKAFFNCRSLRKVTLPEGLERIEGIEGQDAGAFGHCPSLGDVSLPSGLEEIGWRAFAHSGIEADCYTMAIWGNIKLLPYSFEGNGMAKLYILNPDSNQTEPILPSTEGHTFYNCPNLQYVKIEDNIGNLPGSKNDFEGCAKLDTIDIPSTITSLHSEMFKGCKSLKSVLWHCHEWEKNKYEIEQNAFDDTNDYFQICFAPLDFEEMKDYFSWLGEKHLGKIMW